MERHTGAPGVRTAVYCCVPLNEKEFSASFHTTDIRNHGS
jgi:hypothetical protein